MRGIGSGTGRCDRDSGLAVRSRTTCCLPSPLGVPAAGLPRPARFVLTRRPFRVDGAASRLGSAVAPGPTAHKPHTTRENGRHRRPVARWFARSPRTAGGRGRRNPARARRRLCRARAGARAIGRRFRRRSGSRRPRAAPSPRPRGSAWPSRRRDHRAPIGHQDGLLPTPLGPSRRCQARRGYDLGTHLFHSLEQGRPG